MAIETFGKNSKWKKRGEKAGGARGAGEFGGIYSNGAKSALIKQDSTSPNFDIAEYMSSKIFAAISPVNGAVVEMMVPEGEGIKIPGDGSNVYVRSEFFDNYSDMFADMDKHMSAKDKPSNRFRKDGRPLLMGTRDVLSGFMAKAMDSLEYQGFDQIAPGSLLVGDFDMHIGNIGVIRDAGKLPQLKRIDFGWGFANLTKEVHPHSKSKHLPGQGPTNHFREFPRKYKLTEEFVSGLNQAANTDISVVLDNSFAELEKYYDKPTLQKWAQHAMPNEFGKTKLAEIDLDIVKTTLKEVMQARQSSLKEFSIEIKLGLIATPKKGSKKQYAINNTELRKLVVENPDYFKDIVSGKKSLRLRDKKLRSNNQYKKILKEEIVEIRNDIIKEALVAGHKVSKEPKEQRIKSAEVLKESLAKDTVFYAKKSTKSVPMLDSIIQTVRTEIIVTQQLFLQQEIAKTMVGSEKLNFEKQNLTEVQKYLKTDAGKQSVAEVMTQPDLQHNMHKIESAGYQAVHSKFQDSFHDVPWSIKDTGVVRLSNITNDDGQEVCVLKETTIKTQPTTFQLADGNTKIVKSYRQIEFPVGLKEEGGPLHLSMALKDENGHNMPEKDAVYFTAHYNDSGKLTEVSSPIPVKFMGEGNDAIGYIEREGKIYTLPVTQGKYHEMMQEVAVNNGMNIDLTAAVKQTEQRATDKVYSPVIEQAKQIKEKLNPKVGIRDFEKEAIGKLKDIGAEQVAENILSAVKAGDEKLVGAMMEALSKPQKGVAPISDVALKVIYFEGRALAHKSSGVEAAKIERACGKMASFAKVKHDVSKDKGSSASL